MEIHAGEALNGELIRGTRQGSGVVYVLDSTPSTNDYARALAEQGAPSGTVVIADSQTAGRGRMGRSFLSPGGAGLYFSMILRGDRPAGEWLHLTCCTAVAVCRAIEKAASLHPGIKWTNDLVWQGKKLAGILTELSLERGSVRYAIVGIGINCTQNARDFDPTLRDMATSLKMAGGGDVSRNRLAAQLILELEEMSRTMFTGRLMWMEQYRQSCITIGKAVKVEKPGEIRMGTAVDVDEWGALLVDFGDGIIPVQSGEVSVRGMYGYT